MAQNPYVNKVQTADGSVIMDISSDTATPSDVLNGVTFHDRSGTPQTGSLITHNVYDGLDSTSTSDALSANQGKVLNDKITTRQITGGITGVTIYKSGNVVDIQIRTGTLTSTRAQWYKLGTLPSECIPPAALEFPGYDNDANARSSMPIQCKIDTSGNIFVWIFANDSLAARAHICYAV